MTEHLAKTSTRWERIEQLAALLLAAFSLFAQVEPLIRYGALLIALLLIAIYGVSQLKEVWKHNHLRWFPLKLSVDQRNRLDVLIDEIINHMSTSYTLSPFCVWHTHASNLWCECKGNGYHTTVHAWIVDIQALRLAIANPITIIPMLSHAMTAASNLAACAQSDLERLVNASTFPEVDRGRVTKEWDLARTAFNQCLDRWNMMLKEIQKLTNTPFHEHCRPLGALN